MEYDEFQAMNSTVLSAAEGAPERLAAGFTAVRQLVEAYERRFSRFREDSELAELNRSAGHWFYSSPELFEIIEEAIELYHLTGGLFDPSILGAIIQMGYDRSMDEIRQAGPQAQRPTPPWHRPPFDTVRLDSDEQVIFLPEGVQIDLGGIAKGWIAERAARLLHQYSPACAVSAGGDMVMFGLPHRQPGWQVSLEDPRDPQKVLAALNVGPGALATSSVTRRQWRVGDQLRHHIIDPRSGQPCEPTWLSVTVFAPKATHAEAFAKALLIASQQEAPRLAAQLPGLRWMAVSPDGSLWGTQESEDLIHVTERTI